MTRVRDLASGAPLDGEPSDILAGMSADNPSGVPAFRDGAGTWRYCEPADVEHARGIGRDVRTVRVEMPT